MHEMYEEGHLPIVDYLISKGADIEAKDKDNIFNNNGDNI